MAFKRKAAGALVDIAATLSRRSAGAWVGVDLVLRRLSGAWVTVWKRININNQSIAHDPPSGSARAGYALKTDGIAYQATTTTPAYVALEPWMAFGTAADYETRATLLSGTSPTGSAVGSWLALSSNVEWALLQTTSGSKSASITVDIRLASSGAVLATATIDLEASHT